ncbi:MAG TPA: type II CAAX endopeptidase family protein [archaeon]|jgi:membrane protease YdiL (CAAX protease family)|nr:type II CAAX endopeptidase family protein [archaeon]HPV66447.1 type II CAAX endopeptidase family protein [archaeon]
MLFIAEEFILDIFLFFIPFYFIFLFNRANSFAQVFRLQGLKKISFKEFFKKTIIIFLLLFVLSYTLSFFSVLFKVSDLNLVSEEILRYSPIAIVYLFLVRVFLEEWFFRGFLTPRLGVILSSALFAIGHIAYGSIIEIIGAFVLGVFLSSTYKKYNNLWPNVFAHIIYNLVIYLFLVFF